MTSPPQDYTQDFPANNTRQRKASEISSMADNPKGKINTLKKGLNFNSKSSDNFEDNDKAYAQEVLHNVNSMVSPVNLDPLDNTHVNTSNMSNKNEASVNYNFKGRKSVGQLASQFELMSPDTTPQNTPKKIIYKASNTEMPAQKTNSAESLNMSTKKSSALNVVSNDKPITDDWSDYHQDTDHDSRFGSGDWFSSVTPDSVRSNTSSDSDSDAGKQRTPPKQVTMQQPEQQEEEEEEETIRKYKQRLQEKDPTVVFEMFELLLLKMSQVQAKLSSIESDVYSANAKAAKANQISNKTKISLTKIKKDVAEMGKTIINVLQVSVKNEQDIGNIQKRVERNEIRSLKGALTIRGIKEEKDENPRDVVKMFLIDKMEMTCVPEIQTCHRIGKGRNRPMFIKLLDPDNVRIIFRHVSKLKGKTNDNGEFYFIDAQLTETQNVQRRRLQDIKKENQAMPVSHQLDIAVHGTTATIDNQEYVKQVKTPTAKYVLTASTKEKDAFRSFHVQSGNREEYQGSKFMVYTAKVNSFKDVQKAYAKVKDANLAAAHILCGYRIFAKDFPFKQDFSNDGDHQIGKVILDILKTQGVFNVAVFIVRYYDGDHIGPQRFNIVHRLTEQAIASFSSGLEYGQHFQDQELVHALKQAVNVKQRKPRYSRSTRK